MSKKPRGQYEEPFEIILVFDEASDGTLFPDDYIRTAAGILITDGEVHVKHRIVACMNAMEGIGNPEQFVQQARAWRKQVERFVEVLGPEYVAHSDNCPCVTCTVLRNARKLLEGG